MLPGSAPGGHPTPVPHVHPTAYRYTGGASPFTPGGMANAFAITFGDRWPASETY
jgi:hypothetical protein